MKMKLKILPILIILLLIIYYALSLLLMNNNTHVLHYYGYENFKEAKQKQGIIDPNIDYKLVGFTKEQENYIRDNVILYTTKSNYEEFFGFLIRFNHEDKDMIRINLESNKETKLLPNFILNKELRFENKHEGSLTYAQFDVIRVEKSIRIEVIEYQNKQPVKIGEITITLN